MVVPLPVVLLPPPPPLPRDCPAQPRSSTRSGKTSAVPLTKHHDVPEIFYSSVPNNGTRPPGGKEVQVTGRGGGRGGNAGGIKLCCLLFFHEVVGVTHPCRYSHVERVGGRLAILQIPPKLLSRSRLRFGCLRTVMTVLNQQRRRALMLTTCSGACCQLQEERNHVGAYLRDLQHGLPNSDT